MSTYSRVATKQSLNEQEVELVEIYSENMKDHPGYLDSFNGAFVPGVLTVRDTSQLELEGTFDGGKQKYATLRFFPCVETENPECAPRQEVLEFLDNHALTIVMPSMFINMEQIKPLEETIESNLHVGISKKINIDKPDTYNLFLIENRVELHDDRINLLGMTEPKKLSYLNLSDKVTYYDVHNNSHFTVFFSLSKTVVIQKRKVYDAAMMLGDVGGLYDFFCITLSLVLAPIAETFLKASLVQKLYHVSTGGGSALKRHQESSPAKALSSIKPLSFSPSFTMLSFCTFGCLPMSRVRRKALKLGKHKLVDSVDLVKIVRQQRAFKTLLRLLLTAKEQKLIKFQRREAVLSAHGSSSDQIEQIQSDSENDQGILNQLKVDKQLQVVAQRRFSETQSLCIADKLHLGAMYNDWSYMRASQSRSDLSETQVVLQEPISSQSMARLQSVDQTLSPQQLPFQQDSRFQRRENRKNRKKELLQDAIQLPQASAKKLNRPD